MEKPETRATLSTRHRMKTNKANKNTTQKTKMMSNTDSTKNTGYNPGAREINK